MSKWRHDVLQAVDSHGVDPRTRIPRPTRFHGFQFSWRWSTARFFRNPSSLSLFAHFFHLLPRSLPYPRFFNSHAWARMDREEALRPFFFRHRLFSSHGGMPKARAFKRYNRVALWKLMHSIVDLCTIHVEYIGTHFVYEINFVHAPLASRPCNYQ